MFVVPPIVKHTPTANEQEKQCAYKRYIVPHSQKNCSVK